MKKRWILTITATGLVAQHCAQAASFTVSPGDAVQAWGIGPSDTLDIRGGGETSHISSKGGSVTAESGAKISGRLDLEGSTAILNDTILNSVTDIGLHLQGASKATVTGGQIDGRARAVNLISGSVMNMSGTTVYGHGAGSGSTVVEGGLGLSMLGATANVSVSKISGDRFGILLLSDSRGTGRTYNNSLVLDNTQVEGKHDSAIYIGRANTRNLNETSVLIANGTTLDGAGGKLIVTGNGAVSDITIDDSHLTGYILTDGTQGTMSNLIMQNGATLNGRLMRMNNVTLGTGTGWMVTGDSDVEHLTQAGNITFSSGTAGRTLTVNGNYTGQDGLITFNSVLGGDDSITDRLFIVGDTSGNTHIKVNNLGGSGAQTLSGIKLITVGGSSDGTFIQDGRIAAGSYEYQLEKSGSDWRLCSGAGCDFTPPVDPPVNPPIDPPIGPEDLTLRPEAGSYAANSAAAVSMFSLQRLDRYGNADPESGLWLLTRGSRTDNKDTSGQLSTKGNTWVTMLGADLLQSDDGSRAAGAMAGYGRNTNTTRSGRSGYESKGSISGYTAGIYGSWDQSGKMGTGAYIDSWLQYSTFKGTVNGEELSGEQYTLKGPSVSLEGGYRTFLWQNLDSHLKLTPKAQVIWSGVKAGDHTESNGTKVTVPDSSNFQTRAGGRLGWTREISRGSVTPYAEIAWIYNRNEAGVTMDNVAVRQAGGRNVAEYRAGAEGILSTSLSINAELIRQQGTQGYRDTSVRMSVNFHF